VFLPLRAQRLAPHVGRSVAALAERWRAMAAAAGGEVEVDVAEWFQAMAEEAIMRATFGRSYDSGRAVFHMQACLMAFASVAFRKFLVRGYRYVDGVAINRNREITRRLSQFLLLLDLNRFARNREITRRLSQFL